MGPVDACAGPLEIASMLDVALLASGLGFFLLTVGYGVLCDRL